MGSGYRAHRRGGLSDFQYAALSNRHFFGVLFPFGAA